MTLWRIWSAYTGDEPGTLMFWNEWTETGYPEPYDLYGYEYPEAINEVF